MHAVGRRPYVMTGAALAATSMIIVTPVAPRPLAIHIANPAVRLASAGDMLNIPINLFEDLLNVPYNEIQGINTLADSLFFGGTWFTSSATNLFGTDPGDPGHYFGIFDSLLPFPALSGAGGGELDQSGLAQQVFLLAAAELPVSSSCDAETCAPLAPTSPLTGFTGIDRDTFFSEALTGQYKFPLFDHWFTVPLSDLSNGYNFGNVVDPSPGVGSGGAVPSGFGLDGTIAGPGGENLMPWSNTTFTLNLAEPFQNFYNSLLATPSAGLSGIELPTFTEATQALQSLAAGAVVDFYPFVPGSPLCFGTCDLGALSANALVADIGNLEPGNPTIDQYLADVANGSANTATPSQIAFSTQYLQGGQQLFDYGNPSAPGALTPVATAYNDLLSMFNLSNSFPALDQLPNDYNQLFDPAAVSDSSSTAALLAASLGPMFGGDTLGQALDQIINAPASLALDLGGGLIP